MPKNKPAGYQKMEDSMQMHKADWQQPQAVYSQKDDNATLRYMSRADAMVSKEAKQISSQQYKGKYS